MSMRTHEMKNLQNSLRKDGSVYGILTLTDGIPVLCNVLEFTGDPEGEFSVMYRMGELRDGSGTPSYTKESRDIISWERYVPQSEAIEAIVTVAKSPTITIPSGNKRKRSQ
ncbi:hypothetical protein ACFLQN_04575 [Candidatus Aenigmatarchaeota archaeon]